MLLLKWTKLLAINNRIIYISFIIIILIAGAAATSFGTGFYAGQNIEISASKDTYNYKSDTETKKASITIGSSNPAALATDSIGGDIGYSEASQKIDAATHNNSGVTAAKGSINITTGADAKINGANLLAENINLKIGNNLSVESKQNQLNSYGASNSFNLGYDTGAGADI